MNPDLPPAVPREREVFLAALDLVSPAERSAFLDGACAGDLLLRQRVEALLAKHAGLGAFLESSPVGSPARAGGGLMPEITETARPIGERIGDRIGRYKVLEQIGEGGCGVVYVAEQTEPVRRRVALKVIKPGMDTLNVIARFEAERQALARMDHPNIARVLDGGATESGRPFFVMELVRGIKITEYVVQNQLSTGQRLDLFIQVCRAVQHAHQKGIIHRDLKPSNVLVTVNDGVAVPKVIDFGIAKATTGERLTDKTVYTAFEQFIGTPAYMSPEQAMMTSVDIDTRSDIYSLGVLLYELLTGHTPFDTRELLAAGLDGMRKTILEKEPLRPSTRLARERLTSKSDILHPPSKIDRDLDWIVMKCLEKDRGRRYETANALAMDLQRHLNSEPVVARSPSAAYRVQKFARRNWRTVSALVAIFLALVAGLALATRMYLRESEAHERALAADRQQRRLLEEVSQERDRAENAEHAAEEKLRDAYLAQTRAVRLAREPGRHFEGLKALADAAAIRPSIELRNEAIACMLLVDVRMSRDVKLEAGKEVAFWDRDGRRFAVVDRSGHVRIRSLDEPAEDLRLPAPPTVSEGESTYAEFSPDGQFLRVDYGRAGAHVWRLPNPEPAFAVPAHHVEFTPDSRLLVVGNLERGIAVYSLPSLALLRTFGGNDRYAFLRFDPSGQRLGAKVMPGETVVALFDLTSGREITRLEHPALVWDFAWHPDGRHVVTSDRSEAVIKVWDTRGPRVVRRQQGRAGEPAPLSFSRDGQLLASSGWDGRTRLWDFRTGRQLLDLAGAGWVRFSQDDRRLAMSSWDKDLLWWYEVAQGVGLRVLVEDGMPSEGGERVSFNRDGTVLGYTFALQLRLCEPQTGAAIGTVTNVDVFDFLADPSSNGFLLTGPTGWYRLPLTGSSNLPSLGPLEPAGPTGNLWRRAVSADGKVQLALQPAEHRAYLFDGETFGELVRMQEPHPGLRFFALSPDGRWAATGGWNEPTVRIWDARTGERIQTLPSNGSTSVAFSPDGRWLVTGSRDFRFFEPGTWEERRRLPRPSLQSFPPAMAFTPDGAILAVCHSERSIRLLNARSGEELATFEAPEEPFSLRSLSLSPDGSFLAAAGEGTREIHLWNLALIREQLARMGLDWETPQ